MDNAFSQWKEKTDYYKRLSRNGLISFITEARVSLTKCGWRTIAIAIIAFKRPGPRIATNTKARSNDGKAKITSIIRMITVSTAPR